jgi:hypothetical protein
MLQFAPDIDPATPGILVECSNIIPTAKGYAASYVGVNTSYDALSTKIHNIVIVRKLDNTRRFFAATQTKIYEGIAGTWYDRTSGTPDIGADNTWAFAQFGNFTLACSKTTNLVQSDSTTFSDVSGAPKAGCMATGQGFVMLGDTNEVTYGDQGDRWWCSGIYDHTQWTPAVTTQCTTGRLVDTPGKIVGISGYGSTFVAFKENSMYLGSYTGAPSVFTWQLIPGLVGCSSKNAIAQAGPQSYFLGNDNFYVFDGSRPIPIGNPLREWFFKTEVNPEYIYTVTASYDRPNQFVWFFYPSSGSTTLNKALVYHIPTSRWGRVSMDIETIGVYLSDAITIDGMDALSSTIDGLPNISFDSPYWSSQSQTIAIANTSHVVQTLSGNPVSSSFTTGSFGDVGSFSTISMVKPRFVTAPTSATLTYQYDNDYGDSFVDGSVSSLSNGRFDVLWSARWHRGEVALNGPWELIDFKASIIKDGEE